MDKTSFKFPPDFVRADRPGDPETRLPPDWEQQQQAKSDQTVFKFGERQDSRDVMGLRRVAAEAAAAEKKKTSGGRRSMRSRRRSRRTRRSRRYRR